MKYVKTKAARDKKKMEKKNDVDNTAQQPSNSLSNHYISTNPASKVYRTRHVNDEPRRVFVRPLLFVIVQPPLSESSVIIIII
jgi:hypothetical protein